MKKLCVGFLFNLLLVVSMVSSVTAADWRFPVGLSYISGFSEIVDLYENNFEAEGN